PVVRLVERPIYPPIPATTRGRGCDALSKGLGTAPGGHSTEPGRVPNPLRDVLQKVVEMLLRVARLTGLVGDAFRNLLGHLLAHQRLEVRSSLQVRFDQDELVERYVCQRLCDTDTRNGSAPN